MPPCRSPRCSSSPSLERRFPVTTASSTPTASRPPNGFVTLGSTTTAGRAGLVGPDGSAVLIGQAGTNGIFWARVGENGGGGGTCTFTPPGVGAAGAYHGLFDRDGRLVLTGAATYPALGTVLFVARFLYPDCTLDAAFDGDGYFTLDGAADLLGLRVAATRVAGPLPGIWFERLVVAGNRATGRWP